MSKYSINKSGGNTTHGWEQQYFELHANKITVINTGIVSTFSFLQFPFEQFHEYIELPIFTMHRFMEKFRNIQYIARTSLIQRNIPALSAREGWFIRYIQTKWLIDFLINCD